MTVHFITNGGNEAILGTMFKVRKEDLKRYVRMFDRLWVVL